MNSLERVDSEDHLRELQNQTAAVSRLTVFSVVIREHSEIQDNGKALRRVSLLYFLLSRKRGGVLMQWQWILWQPKRPLAQLAPRRDYFGLLKENAGHKMYGG